MVEDLIYIFYVFLLMEGGNTLINIFINQNY